MSDDSQKRKENISLYVRQVESQIDGGMRAGADLYDVVDMLSGVRMMLDAGLYDDAEALVKQARQLASTKLLQFERLSNFLKQGRRQIQILTDKGTDTGEAMRMLEMAEEAMENSDYKLGIGYAIKCIECTRDIIENRKPKPPETGEA